MKLVEQRIPKHRRIFETLEAEIRTGRFKRGDRMPSEAELVGRFGASRITVGRAVRDLQLAGLVTRRAGSGTYVSAPRAVGGHSFGLLIPELGETAIFEPIWQGMMASARARDHALIQGSLNGGAGTKEERAWDLCRQYVDRKVDGVFFAPLELTPGKDEANRRIVRALDEARIPVVLLDRTIGPYPEPGHHDLVGIDNHEAGRTVTEHLLRGGSRRIAFVALPLAAATVDARASGYREALYTWEVPFDRAWEARFDPTSSMAIRLMMEQVHPEAVVCANDWTAAHLMRSLIELGYSVPGDVRIVGIDDVDYAGVLPVPLTSLRQPTRQIGEVALAAMLDRVDGANLPPREILLHGTLVVRESCGCPATAKTA